MTPSMVVAYLYCRPKHVNFRSRTLVVTSTSLAIATAAAAAVLVYVTLGELETDYVH